MSELCIYVIVQWWPTINDVLYTLMSKIETKCISKYV